MVLHSKILGEGTPFLILHGFLGMGDNWKTLALRFSKLGYQLHLIDQRNHGRSFRSPVFNYEVMASDLEAYCEFHQLESVILLGHSMGGKTGMLFARIEDIPVLAGLMVNQKLGAFDLDIYNRIYKVEFKNDNGELVLIHSNFKCLLN